MPNKRQILDSIVDHARTTRLMSANHLKRRIEMGYVPGKILPNGAVYQTIPKGIQHWYDTRTLVRLVTEAFDRNEKVSDRRVCHINGRWRLQIRGKHLRRLLKAMPKVKCTGRLLIEEREAE